MSLACVFQLKSPRKLTQKRKKTNKSLVTKTNTRHPLILIYPWTNWTIVFLLYLFLIEVLELAEFKAGMVEHPVTGKILREKTLDSLLATM